MTVVAFWLIVGAGIAAFIYEIARLDLNRPRSECHHCGQVREICPRATLCVGEECCHRCGGIMVDVDSGEALCPHHSATWRTKRKAQP